MLQERKESLRQWFIPGTGIERQVISQDIQRYLGNDATVRPGFGTSDWHNASGYWIKAHRNLTLSMLADLREDSRRWRQHQSQESLPDSHQPKEPPIHQAPWSGPGHGYIQSQTRNTYEQPFQRDPRCLPGYGNFDYNPFPTPAPTNASTTFSAAAEPAKHGQAVHVERQGYSMGGAPSNPEALYPSPQSTDPGLSTRGTLSKFPQPSRVRSYGNRSPYQSHYIDCQYRGCPRTGEHGFTRIDKMIAHLRYAHGRAPREYDSSLFSNLPAAAVASSASQYRSSAQEIQAIAHDGRSLTPTTSFHSSSRKHDRKTLRGNYGNSAPLIDQEVEGDPDGLHPASPETNRTHQYPFHSSSSNPQQSHVANAEAVPQVIHSTPPPDVGASSTGVENNEPSGRASSLSGLQRLRKCSRRENDNDSHSEGSEDEEHDAFDVTERSTSAVESDDAYSPRSTFSDIMNYQIFDPGECQQDQSDQDGEEPSERRTYSSGTTNVGGTASANAHGRSSENVPCRNSRTGRERDDDLSDNERAAKRPKPNNPGNPKAKAGHLPCPYWIHNHSLCPETKTHYNFISQIVDHIRNHHKFYCCAKCLIKFDSKDEMRSHRHDKACDETTCHRALPKIHQLSGSEACDHLSPWRQLIGIYHLIWPQESFNEVPESLRSHASGFPKSCEDIIVVDEVNCRTYSREPSGYGSLSTSDAARHTTSPHQSMPSSLSFMGSQKTSPMQHKNNMAPFIFEGGGSYRLQQDMQILRSEISILRSQAELSEARFDTCKAALKYIWEKLLASQVLDAREEASLADLVKNAYPDAVSSSSSRLSRNENTTAQQAVQGGPEFPTSITGWNQIPDPLLNDGN